MGGKRGRKRQLPDPAAARALLSAGTAECTIAKALACSRKAVRTESADALPRDLLLDIDLGEETACVAHVGRVIQFFCGKHEWLAERLHTASHAGRESLRLCISWDDTTSGNVLRANTGKKSCVVYCCIMECGVRDPADWFPIGLVQSAALKKDKGGMGALLRPLLEVLRNDMLDHGIAIQPTWF